MGNREGIELLRYAVHMLDQCKESLNQRFTAPQLLRIAEACQKSKWDFYPDEWTERQLQECIQFGIVPNWKEETTHNGGTKYVPVYHNDAENVFRVATFFTCTREVEVNADTLDAAIKWLKGDAPIPQDGEYLDDSFQVDEACTREINGGDDAVSDGSPA